jgi:pimeloyl-ACP methyl ester carboxylesterase
MIRGMHSHSAEDLLSSLGVPVLIVHGTQDPFTPISVAKVMAERIPDARLVVIQDGSHTLPIESPREILAELTPFLKEVFSPS